MSLPLNYAFIMDEIISMWPDRGNRVKVLDYGCGKGLLVEEGLKQGIDINGVEMFSHGSGIDIKKTIEEQNFLENRVAEMKEGVIPYPDNYFDFVVSNTVFEHIPDISVALKEISRVLKQDGMFLNVFPYKGTIREGHCHIPYAHIFPTVSRIQYYWLYLFKILGFGRRKKEKVPSVWANYWALWLKDNTFYLSMSQIKTLYHESGFEFEHIEERYIAHRLMSYGYGKLAKLSSLSVMRSFSRLFCRKYGGLILLARHNIEHAGKYTV